MNMRRTPRIVMILPRVRAGFNGDETINAILIRHSAACSGEVGIERRWMIVLRVPVTASRVSLPNLDQRVGNGTAVVIQYPASDDDALALRLSCMLAREIMIGLANRARAKNGPAGFRERVRQENQRFRRRSANRGCVLLVEIRRLIAWSVSSISVLRHSFNPRLLRRARQRFGHLDHATDRKSGVQGRSV